MVSLSLMARLVEAVRPEARLVLVGDPGQLSSIEAGAVLGDIVGPATGDGIVVLDRVHRFGGGIAALAGGDPRRRRRRGARGPARGARGRDVDRARRGGRRRRSALVRRARRRRRPRGLRRRPRGRRRGARSPRSARSGCCARTAAGPYGVAAWGPQVEGWLAADVDGFSADDALVRGPAAARHRERLRAAPLQRRHRRRGRRATGASTAAFERRGEVMHVSPSRLEAVETRVRDDDPQGAGLAVRHRRRPAARPAPRACSPASCSTPRSRAPARS